jgi:hypothetical protein
MVIEEDNQNLRSRLNILKELNHTSSLKQNEEKIEKLTQNCKNLSKIIKAQKPGHSGYLFAQLKRFCENPNEFNKFGVESLKKQLDRCIGNLGPDVEQALYDNIRQRVPEGDTKDNRWCLDHRYDDFQVFNDAIRTAVLKEMEDVLSEELDEEELPKFYQLMFTTAFGPEDEKDREQWVKAELHALARFAEDVFSQIHTQKDDSSAEGASETDSDATPLQSPRPESDRTEKQEEIPKEDQIDNLCNKLHSIQAEAKEEKKPIDAAVKAAIEKELSEELQDSLYGMIFFLAEDKKHEKGWSKAHCADNMPRLYKAIDKLRQIVL